MDISRNSIAIAAVALTAAFAPTAALADGGTVPANVQADIAKTQADVRTLHDTIDADAGKIQSDVNSLKGTSDRKQAIATLKADWAQLQSSENANSTIKADWEQLKADAKAARAAKHGSVAASAAR
jgi:hypothetical protein